LKFDPGFSEVFRPENLPDWVPDDARAYLQHVVAGVSMRALAQKRGVHASTVMRHVRRLENRRDDPLVDQALACLSARLARPVCPLNKGSEMINATLPQPHVSDDELPDEARRILRRLCETGAFLIVADAMDKAAVMRQGRETTPTRIAVLERRFVRVFALKDWIECYKMGRIAQYRITSAGTAALKRLLASDQIRRQRAQGFEDAASIYGEQHKLWSEGAVDASAQAGKRRGRYNLAESPLTALSRRKDRQGQAFLSTDLVRSGERLREDFEIAQMGPRITQNWDSFLSLGRSGFQGGPEFAGPMAARARVAAALKALGPGLGDIALRCCCFLEGLETAEKRLGWSARSGKIVLRIALQRLRKHYEGEHGAGLAPMG
jgi:lambda repressor-like predicted transcriptional regulator